MSTPSLLNIPYLYKAGTLYSQIPESGAGDFTVSRTTTVANRSTRINKNGLIELVNDNVPRLDYPVGGAVNGCPALLVEPSAINICLRSTWEGGGSTPTGWTPFTSGGTSTPIASLLGNDSVAYSFSTTSSQRVFFSQTITISNATNYTFSFYVESITTGIKIDEIVLFQSGASVVVFVDPDGITIPATTVISKTGRYQVRMLSTATSTTIRVGIGVNGNIAGLFALSRPQFELGSVPTSYIPTTTAAVTRSAEIISDTTATALIGQPEGTIYAEVDLKNKGVSLSRVIYLSDGTSNNEIRISHSVATAGDLQIAIRLAGSLVVNQTSPTAVYFGINKIAVGYKVGTNEVAMYVNGSQIILSTSSGNMPACNSIHLGSQLGTSNFLNDRIRAVALYPNRLPNTAAPGVLSLQSLTT